MTKEEIIEKGTFILNERNPKRSEFEINLNLDLNND